MTTREWALLTPHFTLAEVIHSDTADRLGLVNWPPETVWPNIDRMAAFMEEVRAVVGEPLRVTSWYRSPEVNAAVRGSSTSRHLVGLAVDFQPTKSSIRLAFDRLMTKPRLPWDQLLEERTRSGARWLHIGLAPEGKVPRGQVLLARGEVLGGPMTFEEVA